jgi:hypothetical protein
LHAECQLAFFSESQLSFYGKLTFWKKRLLSIHFVTLFFPLSLLFLLSSTWLNFRWMQLHLKLATKGVDEFNAAQQRVHEHLLSLLENHLKTKPVLANDMYNWNAVTWLHLITRMTTTLSNTVTDVYRDCWFSAAGLDGDNYPDMNVTALQVETRAGQGTRLYRIPGTTPHRVKLYRISHALVVDNLAEYQQGLRPSAVCTSLQELAADLLESTPWHPLR